MIHTPHCDSIILQPFYYETIGQGWEALLELSDDALLQYCSTSPDCEDDDFCHDLRSTLHFMLATPCTTVFGARCDEPLSFRRSSCHSSSVHQSNTWVAAPAIAAHTARF